MPTTTLRLTIAERRQFAAEARRRGISLSKYLREAGRREAARIDWKTFFQQLPEVKLPPGALGPRRPRSYHRDRVRGSRPPAQAPPTGPPFAVRGNVPDHLARAAQVITAYASRADARRRFTGDPLRIVSRRPSRHGERTRFYRLRAERWEPGALHHAEYAQVIARAPFQNEPAMAPTPINRQPVHRTHGEINISRFSHGWMLLKMVWFGFRKLKWV